MLPASSELDSLRTIPLGVIPALRLGCSSLLCLPPPPNHPHPKIPPGGAPGSPPGSVTAPLLPPSMFDGLESGR